jgi:hypothetical protein
VRLELPGELDGRRRIRRGYPSRKAALEVLARLRNGAPPASLVAGQFIHTARTANDAAITLPGVV